MLQKNERRKAAQLAKRAARLAKKKAAPPMPRYAAEKVPVMSGRRCLDRVGPERLRHVVKAINAEALRRDHQIVEVQLHDYGDDSKVVSQGGNASTNSFDSETETNPKNVWRLRKLFSSALLGAPLQRQRRGR